MKKNAWVVTGYLLATVTAVSAFVWQTGPAVENVPVEPVQTAVCAAVEPPATTVAETEPESRIIAPVENAPEPEIGAINDAEAIENEETSEPVLPQKAEPEETPVSAKPQTGDTRVIDGEAQIYIPGFGWIKNEGGGSRGTMVGSPGDKLTGNKVGQMGGSSTVGSTGDINKQVGIMGTEDAPPAKKHNPAPGSKAVIDEKPSVWIPGFGWIKDNGGGNIGTVAEDMYENGHKIGIMD